MGLFAFLRRLFGGSPPAVPPVPGPVSDPVFELPSQPVPAPSQALPPEPRTDVAPVAATTASTVAPPVVKSARSVRVSGTVARSHGPVLLRPLNYQSSLIRTPQTREVVEGRPYQFAFPVARSGHFLDLSTDVDQRWLDYFGLPLLRTPDDVADWLEIPIGQLAWLTHRSRPGHRPQSASESHYVTSWIPKRSGGWRLLEAPKPLLKQVQQQILREILDKVPAHPAAHGFVQNRSILTNAEPHLRQRFVLKLDLSDFYTTVRYSRVVAIFRSLGFSREAAIWLARLTTAALPWNSTAPAAVTNLKRFTAAHLPQGASTSPALANLSAFSLDVRLAGLAEAYRLNYTRYADDLTFSGSGLSVPALREVIPLVRRIVCSERFFLNSKKLRIVRNCERQVVAGVVVNQRPNISRPEYDKLKAILHNCVKQGPAGQGMADHPDFAAHLRGRIAHVMQLNPQRGRKLLAIYEQINWNR
ncbi:reverse transcriptase family protein [Planctomicrobium sp. SH664]|uniref:reverse transcriptase family protein n=1 Tax=Planctomicrobium sp. SH664 TaxID=3448125 RepID=UPI003F5BCFD7